MGKKSFLILVIVSISIAGFLSQIPTISANSPSNMVLAYDQSTTTLNVTITHTVNDPGTHFIESVTIKVNGTTVKTETYSDQPVSGTFMYQYNLTAYVENTINVVAVCNISGQIERETTVGSKDQKIPGYFALGIISVLSCILIAGFTFKRMRRNI